MLLQNELVLEAELLGTATPSETTSVAATTTAPSADLELATKCLVRVLMLFPPE